MDKSTLSPENRRRSTATQDKTASASAPAVQTHTSTGEQSGQSKESGDRSGLKPATDGAGEKGNGAVTTIVERLRQRAGVQLATQKDKATDGIGTVARAFRRTTQELREQRNDTLAQYIDGAAEKLEQLSSSLKNREVGDLFRDVQEVARRQPVVFVGSAFAIGLLGARFFKSSAPHRSHQVSALQHSTGPASNPGEVRSGPSNLRSSASSRQGRGNPGEENR
jgi:hypothetical protein